MLRHDMVETVGKEFLTSNIEAGEYSYVQAAGGKAQLEAKVGHPVSHFKLDIRFEMEDVVVLIETKQNYVDDDEKQLREYLEEERAIHPGKKAICILANTNNDKIKVWKSFVDDEHVLKDEAMLDRMSHYVRLFKINKSNDRETVLKNTYSLNELLHKKDIDENLRSQFVGTSLLYIKDLVKKKGVVLITKEFVDSMKEFWSLMTPKGIRGAIEGVLSDLLDGSDNKAKKIELLQKNVLGNQKVRALKTTDWVEILETIMLDIYRYIDTDSSEGQDVKADGTVKESFFGYYKEDGFKKKKNLGRVEQFDDNGDSKWKAIEEEWLRLFRNHKSVDGLSATAEVSGKEEWLCEAYMKTDYTQLKEKDFQKTLNDYLAYLMKEGKIYES